MNDDKDPPDCEVVHEDQCTVIDEQEEDPPDYKVVDEKQYEIIDEEEYREAFRLLEVKKLKFFEDFPITLNLDPDKKALRDKGLKKINNQIRDLKLKHMPRKAQEQKNRQAEKSRNFRKKQNEKQMVRRLRTKTVALVPKPHQDLNF